MKHGKPARRSSTSCTRTNKNDHGRHCFSPRIVRRSYPLVLGLRGHVGCRTRCIHCACALGAPVRSRGDGAIRDGRATGRSAARATRACCASGACSATGRRRTRTRHHAQTRAGCFAAAALETRSAPPIRCAQDRTCRRGNAEGCCSRSGRSAAIGAGESSSALPGDGASKRMDRLVHGPRVGHGARSCRFGFAGPQFGTWNSRPGCFGRGAKLEVFSAHRARQRRRLHGGSSGQFQPALIPPARALALPKIGARALVSPRFGVIAQLVERLNGIEEVWGSNPHGSMLPAEFRYLAQRPPDSPGSQLLRYITE